jgi:hypothetical protein
MIAFSAFGHAPAYKQQKNDNYLHLAMPIRFCARPGHNAERENSYYLQPRNAKMASLVADGKNILKILLFDGIEKGTPNFRRSLFRVIDQCD